MRVEEPRTGTYTVTLTAHELSALLAGARMAHSAMSAAGKEVDERPRRSLGRVLDDLDAALRRLREGPGPGGIDEEA